MYIGIDVGVSHIGIGLLDQNAEIQDKLVIQLDNAQKRATIISIMIEGIQNIITRNKLNINQIKNIGLGVPGIVMGDVWKKANYLKIDDVPIVEILKKKFPIPIYLDNDSNCAAIGEQKCGVFREKENAVLITVGSGIGGAIITNGKLFKGANHSAAEFGHIKIMNNSLLCSCGQVGCLSTLASMKALRRRIEEGLKLDSINNDDVKKLLVQKDSIAIKEFYIQLSYLKVLISNIITVFDPEIIAIGGGFSYFQEFMPQDYIEQIKHTIYCKDSNCEVVFATHCNNAGIIGAAFQRENGEE